MGKSAEVLLGAAVVVIVAASGAFLLFGCVPLSERKLDLPRISYEERIGSVFLPPPSNPFKVPEVRELAPPSFADATAVWGATGRDRRGHIWVGVSARSSGMSAHLLEYEPDMDIWHDRGSVLEQLKAGGLYRSGEGQIKIHSKIIPADDGRLYFASTDEDGEDPGSMAPPRWGGHLWRVGLEEYRWDHLMAVPEGLVAVSGVGRYVYALGYWGHVLYRYDTLTGASKRVIVGSIGGHVSRNFLAEVGGHAFVPRVSGQAGGQFTAALVEYDNDLREVAATPLEFYLGKDAPDLNHGVVGITYLADGRLLLITHVGQLYQIEPRAGAAAKVSALGWFHPDGESYAPSLFSFSGNDLLAGVTHRNNRYEWVVFDLKSRVSAAFPLDTKGLRDVLLYGSISRDNAGRFYVAGWARNEGGSLRPLVLQIDARP